MCLSWFDGCLLLVVCLQLVFCGFVCLCIDLGGDIGYLVVMRFVCVVLLVVLVISLFIFVVCSCWWVGLLFGVFATTVGWLWLLLFGCVLLVFGCFLLLLRLIVI